MGSFSIWHWTIVLLISGMPLWLLVRFWRRRGAAPPNTQLSGIGGWLAYLAVILCIAFLRNIVEFLQGLGDYLSGFENASALIPLVLVGLCSVAYLAAHLWTIAALFRKKRAFRRVFLAFWILSGLAPFSVLTMLIVPGVTFDMLLPEVEIIRGVSAFIGIGFWYWYVCVSVRVKNTMVN